MKRYTMDSCDQNRVFKKATLVDPNGNPGGVTLVNTYAVERKSPNDVVELAMEIQKADDYIAANTCSKLQVIAEQMTFLKNQAMTILSDAKANTDLHHAACNFKKIPGHVYYLYKRHSGQNYFSMISPQEWGSCPHEYLGAYRLEADQSWTPEEKISMRDKQIEQLDSFINNATDRTSSSIQSEIEYSPMEI